MKPHKLFLIVVVGLLSCSTMYFSQARDAHNKNIALYNACSEGAHYVPTKQGCEPDELIKTLKEVFVLAEKCIETDYKQPQCYMIYSSNVRVYCRITTCASQEYAKSEAVARQFFEIQKSSHGSALEEATLSWVHAATAHASWQWREDKLALNADRKSDLLLCYAEGNRALQESLPGPEKIRLIQSLQVLKAITDAI